LSNRDREDGKPSSSPGVDGSLSELGSAGALSSSVRVGMMLALLGVERITFTDLLLAVKVSKSSLNKSVRILEEAGYVTVRLGFKASGGPRTFIQITEKGKTAIRTHLEMMRRLTLKYLPDNIT
jgi:DNA-binding MarR family transcriptional regulator